VRSSPYLVLLVLCWTLASGCEEKIKPTVLPDLDSKSLPEQESWNSSVILSDSGRTKAVIYAGRIREFDSPRETLLDQNITVHFFGEDGKETSVLTAREGKVDEMTNNLEASGNVVVVSNDSTRLRTEKLFWDNKRQLVHTPEYVLIVSPKERVEGKGLESDQQLRNYRIFSVSGESRAE
jgi:LPS export ABC transporter protein LptC